MLIRVLHALGIPANLISDMEQGLIWIRDCRERLENFEDAYSVAQGAMDISCARRPRQAQAILDQFRAES